MKRVLTFFSILGLYSIPQLLVFWGIDVFYKSRYNNVYSELWNNFPYYGGAFLTTLLTGAISIGLSVVFGIIFGIIIGYNDKYLGFFENTSKFIWSLPLIAVANYLNIVGLSGVMFSIVTGVFVGIFPIISYSYRKCIDVDDKIINMVASFNLNKKQEFFYFRIPEIIKSDNINGVLAQSVPLAYIGVTMGEWLVSNPIFSEYIGLGSIFRNSINDGRYDKVYVTMFFMMALVYSTGVIAESFPKLIIYIKYIYNKIKVKFNILKK